MKILIVEDSDFKIKILDKYLVKFGIDYMVAETYIEAIVKLTKYNKEFAGVIVDLGFFMIKNELGREENYSKYMGINLIKEINKKFPNMPVLINSDTKIDDEHKNLITYFDHISPWNENITIIIAFLECCKEYYNKK